MIFRLGLAVAATEKFAHGLSIIAWDTLPMAILSYRWFMQSERGTASPPKESRPARAQVQPRRLGAAFVWTARSTVCATASVPAG